MFVGKVNGVGIFIGVNAACINVITEWLSDFKLGYCSQGWYLNQQFCCWQESLETCTAWKPWSSITLINFIFYVLFAVPSPFPKVSWSKLTEGGVCVRVCVSGSWICSICSGQWNQ
jgi:hypothetical protein